MSKIIFLDTETTTYIVDKARMWQFAASKYDTETKQNFEINLYINVDRYEFSIDALVKCNPDLSIINSALQFKDVAYKIAEFLELNSDNKIIYVAHNAKFDREILLQEFISHEIRGVKLDKFKDANNWVDTYKVAMTKYQDATYNDVNGKDQQVKLNLSFLYYLYCMDSSKYINFHAADSDVEALKLLFKHLNQWYKLDDMINISNKPVMLTTFRFGKYVGKLISDVVHNDIKYIQWMVQNLDSLNPEAENFDENLYYSIQQNIKDL